MIRYTVFCVSLLVVLGMDGPALAGDLTPSPPGARSWLISPRNGDTLQSPVTVLFGLEGMGVAPAGVDRPNTGHHHLLINIDLPDLREPIPATGQSLHFGGGQTQTTLVLPPGKYTLRLLLGDKNHVPHDPPVYSEVVSITVTKSSE